MWRPHQRIREEFYNGPDCDVAVFYGLHGNCRQAFLDYRNVGKKGVYVDLGYWQREMGGKLTGYHKVPVNARHPTAYFQRRPMPENRFKMLGVPIRPWRKEGTHILLAGMGAKAAPIEGFRPNQWEEAAVRELRKYTDRPIIYRPKPSWRSATPVEGTIYSPKEQKLQEVLNDCWATVSHHSNVCVDGLLEGIWEAVDLLGADRIGHGCSAIDDKALLRRLARDRILVECCLTSNYQTGAVPLRGSRHPIFTFLEHGIPVAGCTDNTSVSDTDQTREDGLLADELTVKEIAAIHREAAAYSFIRRAPALVERKGRPATHADPTE